MSPSIEAQRSENESQRAALKSSSSSFLKSADLESMNANELRAELSRTRGFLDSEKIDFSSVDFTSGDAPSMRVSLRALYRLVPASAAPVEAEPEWLSKVPPGVVVVDGVPLCGHCMASILEAGPSRTPAT